MKLVDLSTNNTGAQTRVLCFVLDNYLDRDIYQKDIQNIEKKLVSEISEEELAVYLKVTKK